MTYKLGINMLEESKSKVKNTLVQLYFKNYLSQMELLYITRNTYIKMKKRNREKKGLFVCLIDCFVILKFEFVSI